MKRLIIILSILLTLTLAGILHGRLTQPDEVENERADQTSMNRFPDPMSDVIPDPMAGFRVY